MEHIRCVLDARPKKDDHELSAAARCLGAFRAELIAAQSKGEATSEERERLSHLNAIISVVMSMHFPLGNPPWAELEKAKIWLGELVEAVEH